MRTTTNTNLEREQDQVSDKVVEYTLEKVKECLDQSNNYEWRFTIAGNYLFWKIPRRVDNNLGYPIVMDLTKVQAVKILRDIANLLEDQI